MKTQADIFTKKSGSKKCINLRINCLAMVELIPKEEAC
jgi:hypothetical protein